MPGGQTAGSCPLPDGKIVSIVGSGSPYRASNVCIAASIPGSSQPSISAIVVPVPSMPLSHRSPML